MSFLPDKKKEKEERNERIRKDWTNGMSRPDIAKKYNVSSALVSIIVRDIPRKLLKEKPILTEAEQRIKDNLEKMDSSKFHKRDFMVRNLTNDLEPLITVRPSTRKLMAYR